MKRTRIYLLESLLFEYLGKLTVFWAAIAVGIVSKVSFVYIMMLNLILKFGVYLGDKMNML